MDIKNKKDKKIVSKFGNGGINNMFKKMELSVKNKRIYNILGDYPDVVAKYLVNKMISNTDNNVKINWLTNRKAAFRFMTCMFKKRDFFKDVK